MELQPLDTNAVATSPSKLKDSLTNDAASMNSTATELSENVTQQSSPVAALKSGAYDLSKMDMSEAEAPKEQDLSTIALSERLSSKQWKHRVSGYEELLQMFKKAGTATTPFVEHVSTVVTAITIEKTTKTICAAVDLVKAYIEFAPAPSCLEQLGTTESLVHHIVKLTFAQNKSCLNRAYETIFTMIEKIEDGGTIVTETLCTYFSKSQKLKVAVAAAACLRESIAAFGCNAGAMPFGPIVKHVNALFEHTSKNVRSAAEKLVVEISAWTKTCDIFSFTSLKDIQQRDLRTACDKVIGRGELRTPTRWTPKTIVNRESSSTAASTAAPTVRSSLSSFSSSSVSAATPTGSTAASTTKSMVLDTNDELWAQIPATSFNGALQKTNFYKSITESKWNNRHAAWENACGLCGRKNSSQLFRLEAENFGDIFRAIKATLTNDNNMKVRVAALHLTGKLAAGVRAHFIKYAKSLFPIILSLFKEKHKVHKMAVDGCLDQLLAYSTIDLNEIFQTCISVNNNKEGKSGALHDSNPLVRAATLETLTRYVQARPSEGKGNKWTSSYKELMDHILETASEICHSDKVPAVREMACLLLSALFLSMGPAHPSVSSTIHIMTKTHPKILSKIMKLNGGGEEEEKKKTSFSVATSVTSSTSAITTTSVSKRTKKKTPLLTTTSTAEASTASRTSSSSSKNKAANDTVDGADIVALEEAKAKIQELNLTALTQPPTEDEQGKDTQIVEMLLSTSLWKDKETAINEMSHWMADANNAEVITTSLLEAWMVILSSATKQFTERNRNVLKAAVCNIQHAATACGSRVAFPTRALSLFVQPLVAKFSERVLLKDLQEMYLLVAECVGPQSIASRISAAMEKTTSPAVLENAFKFLTRLICEFSRSGRTVSDMFHVHKMINLAKHVKVGLGHRLPKIKDSAEGLILEVCRCSSDLGGQETVVPLLEDVNPSRLKGLHAKIQKISQEVEKNGTDVNSRAVKIVPKRSCNGGSGGEQEEEQHHHDEAMVEAKPVGMDLSARLSPSLFKQMATENEKEAWKKRMAAVDTVTATFKSVLGNNGVVLFTRSIHDLMQALKKRMSDPNSKVSEKSVQLVGLVANKVGPPIAKCTKIVLQPLLRLLLGNKKRAVAVVSEVLDKWVTHGGTTSTLVLDTCLPFVADALMQFVKGKKSAATAELLSFSVKHLAVAETLHLEPLESMVSHVLYSLGDKEKRVRDSAESLLSLLASRVGEDVIRSSLGNIKGQHGKNIAPTVNQILLTSTGSQSVFAAASTTKNITKSTKSMKSTKTKKKVKMEAEKKLPESTSTSSKRLNKGKIQGDAQKVVTSQQQDEEDNMALFTLTDGRDKARRAKADGRNKWVRSDDPKTMVDRDVIRQLKDQMESVVAPTLLQDMWPTSKNDATCARSICSACTTITTTMQEMQGGYNNVVVDGLLSSLDLLFKWMTLHVDTGKAQVVGSLLECLGTVLMVVQERSLSLSSYEIGVLYPYCTLLVGHKITRMKEKYREIMQQLGSLFPIKELCPMLMHGIDSNILKNSKSRVQNLEEIGRLVSLVGHRQFFTKTAQITAIAQHLDDRAGDVREATLQTLEAIWRSMGCTATDFVTKNKIDKCISRKGIDMLKGRLDALRKSGQGISSSANTSTNTSASSFSSSIPATSSFREPASRGLAAPAIRKGLSASSSVVDVDKMRHRLTKTHSTKSRSTKSHEHHEPKHHNLPSIDLSDLEQVGRSTEFVAREVEAVRRGEPSAHRLNTPTNAPDVMGQIEAAVTVEGKVIHILSFIHTWLKQTIESSTVLGAKRLAGIPQHEKDCTLHCCKEALKAVLTKLVAPEGGNYDAASVEVLEELSLKWESIVVALSQVVIAIYRGVRVPGLLDSGSTTTPVLSGGGKNEIAARRSLVSNAVSALLGTGIHPRLGASLTSNGVEHLYYTSIVALTSTLENNGPDDTMHTDSSSPQKIEMDKAFNELAMRTMYKSKRVENLTALVRMLTKSEAAAKSRLSLEIDDEEASLSPAEVSPKGCLILCKLMDKSIRREKSKPEKKSKPFHGLDLDPLLSACAQFLEAVRLDSDRSEIEQAPLRTIKMVLIALSESLGERVFDYTTSISPNSAIFQMLRGYVSPAGGSTGSAVKGSVAANTIMTPATELAQIFAKVQANTSSDAMIGELYDFQQRHPHESMEPLLSDVSAAFREHICERLQNVAKHRANSSSARIKSSTSASVSGSSLSMEVIRARLAASSLSSPSPAAPQQMTNEHVPPSVTTTTTVAATTTTVASTKKPLDLNSLRARLSQMKR